MKGPWWTKLSENSIAKSERQRRRRKSRKPSRKYTIKTDTQKLKALCTKHGLTTRGNTREIIVRLIHYCESLIESYQKKGAPECFGQAYTGGLCYTCVLQSECQPIMKDLRKIRKLMTDIDVKRKLKSMIKKETN